MADNAEACTFIKKSFKNKNMRKRTVTEDADEEEVGPAVPAKSSKKVHGAAERSEKDEIKEGPGSFFYESTKQIQTDNDNNATATRETETAFDRDARAIRERILKQADDSLKGKSGVDDKLYKGLHGYTDHKAGFRREHTISGEKAGGAHGPLRASAHIRWSVRFDYQPDICKDYKETGYCGYGDACKFMHDRGDYKSGWQIDREWDEAEKIKKERLMQRLEGEDVKEEDEDDDELPFACFICREPYTNPVVTHCKHYFCERCALEHHRRDKHCYVCNKPTSGVFNTAHEILKRERDKAAASNS